ISPRTTLPPLSLPSHVKMNSFGPFAAAGAAAAVAIVGLLPPDYRPSMMPIALTFVKAEVPFLNLLGLCTFYTREGPGNSHRLDRAPLRVDDFHRHVVDLDRDVGLGDFLQVLDDQAVQRLRTVGRKRQSQRAVHFAERHRAVGGRRAVLVPGQRPG